MHTLLRKSVHPSVKVGHYGLQFGGGHALTPVMPRIKSRCWLVGACGFIRLSRNGKLWFLSRLSSRRRSTHVYAHSEMRSAPEIEKPISSPLKSGFRGLVQSMIVFPSRSPQVRTACSVLCHRVAKTITSALCAASPFGRRRAAGNCCAKERALALSGSRTPNATSCPRLIQALPRVVPTLPAAPCSLLLAEGLPRGLVCKPLPPAPETLSIHAIWRGTRPEPCADRVIKKPLYAFR